MPVGTGIEVALLGHVDVRVDGTPVPLAPGRQRALFVLLALAGGREVSTERIVSELWSGEAPASARHAVHVHVSAIRRMLAEHDAARCLERTTTGYRLRLPANGLDATAAEQALTDSRALTNPQDQLDRLTQALALWSDESLADLRDYDFAAAEAGRLDDLRRALVLAWAQASLDSGRPDAAIGPLRGVVEEDPLAEEPRRLLMLALYHGGRHVEALAEFQDAVAALDEFGLLPSRELQDLQAQILRHEVPSTGATSATDSTAALRATVDVPAPPSRMIGRDSELETVLTTLADPQHRLVTLLGPGGIGKSRLAVALGWRAGAGGAYPGGTYFVSLGELPSAELVLAEAARTLGASVTGAGTIAAIADRVGASATLVVLDNFEHVLDAAAQVAELLAAAPKLDVLVTSREPLRVRAEQRVRLQGLAPADAVAMFRERGAAVAAIDDVDEASIAAVCELLDGSPLAIELAAAQLERRDVAELRDRLPPRLDLGEELVDLPERQQTLRRTVDWSYRLLSDEQQATLRRLGVAPGGVREETLAELVVGLAEDPVATAEALAEKSLVIRETGRDDHPRWRTLETVREFALETLEARGETASAQAALAGHFGRVIADWREQGRPDGPAWVQRNDADFSSLRASFDWLMRHDPDRALELCWGLDSDFWAGSSRTVEGADWFLRSARAARADHPRRAIALMMAGFYTLTGGRAEAALPIYEGAIAAARAMENPSALSQALQGLAMVHESRGELDRALDLMRQGVEISATIADPQNHGRIHGVTLTNLAGTYMQLGRPADARPLFAEALELYEASGSINGRIVGLQNLAEVSFVIGDLEAADRLTSEGLELTESLGISARTVGLLAIAANTAVSQGEPSRAARHLRDALSARPGGQYDKAHDVSLVEAAAALAATTHHDDAAVALWTAVDRVQQDEELIPSDNSVLRELWAPRVRERLSEDGWDAAVARSRDAGFEAAFELIEELIGQIVPPVA